MPNPTPQDSAEPRPTCMFCDVDVDAMAREDRRRHYRTTHKGDIAFMILAALTVLSVLAGMAVALTTDGSTQPFMQP